MSNGDYVYYAQSKAHPSDPMYSKAYTRKYDLAMEIAPNTDQYIVFRYSARDGSCKVISV